MEDNNLKTLYNSLKRDNYDVPDNYDSFERTLTNDKHARRTLYNSLKRDNYDVPDSYDSFDRTLFPAAASQTQDTQAKVPGTTTAPNALKQQDAATGGSNSTLGKLGTNPNSSILGKGLGALHGGAIGGAIGALQAGGQQNGGGTNGYQWSYNPPQPEPEKEQPVVQQNNGVPQQPAPTTSTTTTTTQKAEDDDDAKTLEFMAAANKGVNGRDISRGVDQNGNHYSKEIKGNNITYYYDDKSVAQYVVDDDGNTKLKRYQYSNGDVDVHNDDGSVTKIETPHYIVFNPSGEVAMKSDAPFFIDPNLSKAWSRNKGSLPSYIDEYAGKSEAELHDVINKLSEQSYMYDSNSAEYADLAARQNSAALQLVAKQCGFANLAEAEKSPGKFDYERFKFFVATNYPCALTDKLMDGSIQYEPMPNVWYGALIASELMSDDILNNKLQGGDYYINSAMLSNKEELGKFYSLCLGEALRTGQRVDGIIKREWDKISMKINENAELAVDGYLQKWIDSTPKWLLYTGYALSNSITGGAGANIATSNPIDRHQVDLLFNKYQSTLSGGAKLGADVIGLVADLPLYMLASEGAGALIGPEALAASGGARVLQSTLTMTGVGLVGQGVQDWHAGEFSGFGQWLSTTTSSAATGATLSVFGEAARGVALRPTSKAAVLFNKGVEYTFETAGFTLPEWVSTVYNGVTPEGDPITGDYFWHSAVHNLGVVVAMKGRKNFKNWKPVVNKGDLAQLQSTYPDLYDNLTHNLDMVTRGKPVDELSDAARKQLAQLQDDMNTPGKGVSWTTYKKTMNLFGFEVVPPRPSSVRVEGNVVQVLDSGGNVITEKKCANNKAATQERDKLHSQIEHDTERVNAQRYDAARREKLYYDTCSDIADRMSDNKEWRKRGEDGNFLVDENGNYIPDENYRCVTPEDVDAALKEAYQTPEGERTADQVQLITTFEAAAKQMSNSVPTVRDLAQMVCDIYGISVDQLERASNLEPSSRRKGDKTTQAMALFNDLLNRGVTTSGKPVGRVKLKTTDAVNGDTYIDVYNEANPANKDGYYFYKDANGTTRWLAANEVESYEPIMNESEQRYKVSNDNAKATLDRVIDTYTKEASLYNDELLDMRINNLLEKYDLKLDDEGNILRKEGAKRGEADIDENGMRTDDADLLKLQTFLKVRQDRAAAKQGEDNMRNLRSERERAEAVAAWGQENGVTYDVDYLVEHPLELDELVKKMNSGETAEPGAASVVDEGIGTTDEPVGDTGVITDDMLPSIEETVDWMFPNASEADRAAYIDHYTKHPEEIEKSRKNFAIMRSHQQPQSDAKVDNETTTGDTTKTAPTSIEAGGRYNIVDEQGAQHEVEVLRDNGNGTVEVRVDGAEDSMPMAKDQLAAMLGVDVALPTQQTEPPVTTTKLEQPAPVATNEMKEADVDAGEAGLSLREKAGAYVDAYFPDVKGDEREGFIEQLVAQNDFENTIRFDKEDGVNLDRVAKYEQRLAELEKERAATNSKEASDDSGEAIEPYRIDEAADPDAIAEAGFSEDNLAATVDYLNGKIDKRKYLERLGFDKDVLAGIDDDKVNTWVEGVANRASEFLTDKPVESGDVKVESDEVPADAGTTLTPTPQPEAADATEVEATTEPMPLLDDGNPNYAGTTPERGRQYIYDESGLDKGEADAYVSANLASAEKDLDKIKKKPPKMGTNLVKYQKDKADWGSRMQEAQSNVDYWNKVRASQADYEAEQAKARKAADAKVRAQAVVDEQARQAEEVAKQQEQAERGAGAVHPAIAEKWNNAPKIEGYKDEVVLANGERVPGTYYLVESGAVTPSHNASREFEKYEGFPVDENGNTINDRDYERDKDAQNITRSIADKYDSRALQSPVIVSKDGVVLSGNGRTMAGELAASNNTDGAYIEHLKNYGRKYGFSPEQVTSMKHPRAVFVPDADMPYTTDTFAKFNAQEMKGQSKTEQAVKLGKVVDDATFNQIVRAINDHEALGDFYGDTKAATEAINALRRAGAINDMQYAEMFDGDAVSDRGRQIIENMLIGKAFEGNPDVIRMLTEYKGFRQSVVTALNEISTNVALGKDYSLENELAQGIELAYKARKAGFKENELVSPYATQLNLFPFEDGETVADYNNAAVLLLADLLNDKRPTLLKKKLQDYNQQSAESAAGQMDIFAGGVKEKKEIIKTVLNTLHNGETEETSRPEQRGSVADERGGEASLQENGAGDNGEQDSAALITPQAKPAVAVQEQIALAEQQTETSPSEAQKEAGNYKKGHVKIDGFDISIEQPKGSVRSGVDASGKSWRQKMNNTYGYIRGTEGVDGDHIDVFLSDDPSQGDVFVVDQVNNDGSFDEHKVMYGFNSEEDARKAYLSNYEDGWQGLGAITAVSKDEFKKWIGSSHRKTKPFAEYKNVKVKGEQADALRQPTGQTVDGDTHPVSAAKSSQKSEVAEAPKERIDDVGEKIEGAKKDLAHKMGERINLDADTFPKMFPKYDLKQLISQGLDPSLAVMTKMLRQMAQADYKHYSKKRMYGKSYALRAARFYAAYAKQVLEAGDSNVDFKSEGLGFTDYGKQFVELNKRLFEELHKKLGDDIFDLDLTGVKMQPISQKEGTTWYRRNQETGESEPYNPAYAFIGPRGQSYYEANELDKALQEGVEQVSKSIDYKKTHPYKLGHYYKPGVKNSDYVGVKLGGKVVPLTEPMTSSEVRKYMSEHNAELQAKAAQLDEQRKLDKKKGGTGEGRWKPELTLGGGRPRVGADRRGGVDIEAEKFMKSFGFRGVQFGNYVTQRERQRFLNEAYDALMDMAELLGISPRALAIDGRLGLAIGARGDGKANAHYEPKENVINLTKSKGAGSLAHEWFHALDYYFNKSSNRPTSATSNKSAEQFPASTRDEMRKAFLDLMRAIKNSDYYNRSVALEQKLHPQQLGEGYYDKPTELGARAFQDYVVRKLTDQGKINDFLSSFTSEKDWNGEPENYPYPVGAEAEKIDEKFDALFDAMQERTDEEGNTILYHLGKDNEVLTDTEVALRDGLVEVLRGAGIEVVTDEAEGQRVLDAANRAADVLDEMKKRNQQQETALPEDESSFKGTAISSADGAKIIKNLDTLAKESENISTAKKRTFLGDIADALGAKRYGSKSRYLTVETINGNAVTIRLADHNATISNFDHSGRENGISIVVSRKPNAGITNDGEAHIVEFFYPDKALRKSNAHPYAGIVRSLQQTLYSGEYKDTTGLAERQEVNEHTIREMRAWHGSGADFDAFDHIHMGEGEGAQAYGWGTYVTQVEGIARNYAEVNAKKPPYLSVAKRHRNTAYENFINSRNAVESCKRDIENYEKRITANKEYIEELEDSRAYILKEHGESSVELENWDFLGQKMLSQVREEIEADKNRIASSREYLRNLEKMLPYLESEYEKAKAEVLRLDAMTKRYLYEVEIPDNDGTNYLSWDEPLTDEQFERIALAGRQSKEFAENFDLRNDPLAWAKVNEKSRRGDNVYSTLSNMLGARKASELLSQAGFVGIEYPAQYRSGGRDDGAKNYVIFDEGDLKINSKAQFFRTGSGEVYGFVRDGKIYIDPRVASAETPVHEYSHLWADALKRANPEAWERLKETMLGEKDVLEHVKRLYPELEGDELLAEVFSHYSGKRGAERLRADMEREMKNAEDVFAKARVARVFDIIRRALSRFWEMARDLFAGKTRGLDKLTAEDFADMAMNDLLRGFKPSVAERTKGERGSSIVFERGSSYRNGNGDVIRFESHAEQLSLFGGGEQSSKREVEQTRGQALSERVKRASEMSDAELLKEMQRDIAEFEKLGRGDWGIQTACTDEYDRRHIKEYNAECERVRTMLDENNVSIEEAEDMLCNAIYSWRDGYATADRSKLLAQFDTLNDYYAEKTDERDNADLYQEVESEQAISEADARNTETPTQQEVAPTTQQTEPAKPKKAAFDPSAIKLRKLKSGETCYVERRYQESGGFDFTGSEVVKSDEDLAYIFRNLENSAIENTFLVLIKDGKATILHTGMGSYSAAVGHTGAGMLAASQFKPQNVIMVHNHPSGSLIPSMQDVELQKRVKRMFGENVVREAIIIDITSGQYSVFDTDNTSGTIKQRPTSAENEVDYKTYSFSKYVFNKGYKPGSTMQITDANKAAAFVSSHRLGERDKLSLLVMNRAKYITGNVFLPWTNLDDVDITKAANKIATYIHQMGGESGIIYGSGTIDRSKLGALSREIENHEVRLDDFINVEGVSAQVQGVLEDEVLYEAVPRNTEQQPTEVAEDGVGYGEADDSGISDEELAGYDAGRYSFAESITQGLVDLALKNTHDQQLRLNAMREFGGNLAKLRKIMNRQKAYDKGTVDDIVRLARMVMGSGFFKDMSAYEVKRLLAAIKKGVGAEDLTPIANNVVDMLVQHQLRESKNMLHKLMQVRGRKVDARGVEVQAGLDIDGQRMMSALKDGMSLGENGLLTRINDCENRLGSEDEVIRKNAMSEYQGLMLAKEYHDNILSGEEEEIVLRNEKRQEQEKIYDFRREPVLDDDGNAIINQDGSVRTVERKTLKPEFKTNVTDDNKRFRKDVEAAIEKIEQSIRENRMERVTAYSDFMSDVAGDVRASRERAAAWRDEQLRRVEEIHHNANSDLQDIDPKSQTKEKKFVPIFNPKNDLVRGLFMPLATFEKFMRFFGRRFHNGEGYLFDRFVRGMIDCSDKEWRSKRAAHDELDAKVTELFGKTKLGAKRHWSDLFELERKKKYPTIPVEYWDNGERVRESLSQGEALSLYVWSKQKDAEAGLRRMGISEEDMETLKGQLNPKFVELADWVVSDFLPRRRDYYNEVYERMFGAPMAAIENYFPIVRNSRDVEKPTDVAERDMSSANASTITGSFIKRVRTAAALDIHTDFFSHLLKHLDDMEHIAAWAEFNRDLNTLRNYKRFKNRVSNMNSFEFGAGKDLWKAFDNCCAIVAGVYEGNAKSKLDKITLNINKGFTGGAIAFRFNTALKQLLSLPAFWSDASADQLLLYQTNPVGNFIAWKWAMQNLPGFSKRWQSRQVGDTRLMDTDMDWKLWRNKYMKYINRGGMLANAFVDAVTVASGAKAVYETKKRRYKNIGYTDEQAERKALQDAAISYNGSQQSSESGFVSEMQVDRTFLNNMLTIFRNSPFSYGRKMTTGLRELKKRLRPGYKSDFIEAEAKKMEREGIPEDNAKKAARRLYRFGGLHAMFDVFNYGYLLSFLWTVLGGSAWYLLFGEDDEKKKEIIKDGTRRLWFSPIEGFTGGNTLSEKGGLLLKYASDEDGAEKALEDFVNWSWFTTPMEGETDNFLRDVRFDEQKAMWDVLSLAIQANLGFKPETFTDGVAAIVDYCDGDPQTSKEFLLCFMRVMQVPQSQTDNVYFDELGMTAKDAQKLNAMEMADRYAKYKRRKNDPLSYIAHSDDEDKIFEKYRKRFLDNMKERMMKMDEEQLNWNFDNPNDSERRKAVGKVYSKQNDVKGSAWNKPGSNWKPETRRAHLKYQRYQTWEDLAEDTMLDMMIQQAENRGDNETAKALKDGKKKLTEIKHGKHTKTIDINGLGEGGAEEDKAIMEELRSLRKELIEEYSSY